MAAAAAALAIRQLAKDWELAAAVMAQHPAPRQPAQLAPIIAAAAAAAQ
jgi:hypothetical protein